MRVSAATFLVPVGVAVLTLVAPPALTVKVFDFATGAAPALWIGFVAVGTVTCGMVRALTLTAAGARGNGRGARGWGYISRAAGR